MSIGSQILYGSDNNKTQNSDYKTKQKPFLTGANSLTQEYNGGFVKDQFLEVESLSQKVFAF